MAVNEPDPCAAANQCLSALLFYEISSRSFLAEREGNARARVPRISCLRLEAGVCVLSFCRNSALLAGIGVGSRAQSHRSKSKGAALLQVGYCSASADSVSVPESNRDAAEMRQRGFHASMRLAEPSRSIRTSKVDGIPRY